MKIRKLLVIDDKGNEHTWTGEGFVHPIRSESYNHQELSMSVTAHIVLPSKGRVSA